MKKLFISLVALLLSASAINAQSGLQAKQMPGLKVQQNSAAMPADIMKKAPGKRHKAPSRIVLADNQRILAYNTGEELPSSENGLGIPSAPGNNKAAIVISKDMLGKFVGGKIVMIRFGLCNAIGSSNVFILPYYESGMIGEELSSQKVETTQVGWNDVRLDTPVEITDDVAGYFIGFEYVQKSSQSDYASFPLAVSGTPVDGTSLIYLNGQGGPGWYDVGLGDIGNFCIQAIVEKDDYPAKDIELSSLYTEFSWYKKGSDVKYAVSISNFGMQKPESYELKVALGDRVVATVSNPVTLTNAPQEYVGSFTVPADMASGVYNMTVSVGDIDGSVPVDVSEQATGLNVYDGSVGGERQKYLIEQATSQMCTYCPLGETLLKRMDAAHDDLAWVAMHGSGMGNDIFNIREIDYWEAYVNCGGYPSATFNRLNIEGSVAFGIGYQEQYAAQMAEVLYEYMRMASAPALATIDIATEYDKDTRGLSIRVNGTGSGLKSFYGDDAVINVYLTEDGLTARQLNQGRWVNDYTHNHVMRQFVTTYQGDVMSWNGDSYENNYNVTLNPSWNADNMKVVAFITRKVDLNKIDPNQMDVNNAELVEVGKTTTGIDSNIIENANTTEIARYTSDGKQIDKPVKGINIVKMSNGKTMKVIVK